MNIELLRKLGEGLFTANGGEGHYRFESRAVIPAGSSGHGRLLCSAKQPICRQKSHLATVFSFSEPPLSRMLREPSVDERTRKTARERILVFREQFYWSQRDRLKARIMLNLDLWLHFIRYDRALLGFALGRL